MSITQQVTEYVVQQTAADTYQVTLATNVPLSGATPQPVGTVGSPGTTGLASDAGHVHANLREVPEWSVSDLATSVRRWIGDQTFAPGGASSGVRLLDDQAARYGSYDDITIVGLIESEWPERPRRKTPRTS